jgi:hypothetical protein
MKDLVVGDEIYFDYGMCETDERLWEPMKCECGTSSCRGYITANDWKLYPNLWDKYNGFFAPHVQRLIDQYKPLYQMNNGQAESKAEAAAGNNDTTNSSFSPAHADVFERFLPSFALNYADKLLTLMGLTRTNRLNSGKNNNKT